MQTRQWFAKGARLGSVPPIAICAERGPVCLGDRASPPQLRPFTDRALTVTRIPAVVESKSRSDRAEPSRSCPRDTAAAGPLGRAISTMARGFDPPLDIAPLNRTTLQAPPVDFYPQTVCLFPSGVTYEAIAISGGQIRSDLLPDIFIETQNAFVR